MKILIPVEEKNIETKVCVSFGRAPYFLICDSENEDISFIDNIAITSPGGAGIKAAQMIVDNDIDVLLTQRCGENAADILYGADIKIYKTIEDLAMDNVKLFVDNKLKFLDEIHSGFHNHQGN